jgi:hypothetical protein
LLRSDTTLLLPGSLPTEIGTMTNLTHLCVSRYSARHTPQPLLPGCEFSVCRCVAGFYRLLQGGTAGAFDSIGSIGAAGRRSLLRSLLMHEESGLTGTLPSELGRLTNLVELYVPFLASYSLSLGLILRRLYACD